MYTILQINLLHVHYHAIKRSFMYTIMQLKPLSCRLSCNWEVFHVDYYATKTSFMYTIMQLKEVFMYIISATWKTSFVYTIMQLKPLSCTLSCNWDTSFMLHWSVQHEIPLSCYTDQCNMKDLFHSLHWSVQHERGLSCYTISAH